MSSLKRNIVASYAGQVYVTAIGVVMVPVFLRYMGAEAYGLVGFYSMLQAWFMLLDMGLTPTMVREAARFRGGSLDALTLRRFVRTSEGIFLLIGILGASAIIFCSEWISSRWLQVQHLPLEDVQRVIILIALICSFRWVSGPYRGVINGFERLVWLNAFNMLVATLRFVFVIALFVFVGTGPVVFFQYQAFVAIVELLVLISQTYRLMPHVDPRQRIAWQWRSLRSVFGFTASVAISGSLWIVVTQTDKLILSKLLPLSEYGYFSVAVLLASGVILVSSPISSAIIPRMVSLSSAGNNAGMLHLYRNATQVVAVMAIPTSLVMAFFSRHLLFAWTGDVKASNYAASLLILYAAGNAILAMSTFPYYLQFAKGTLRLHLIGSGLFLAVLVPAVFWQTSKHGVVGAGYAWLSVNIAYFLIWVPIVHHRFAKGLHKRWLIEDQGAIVMVTVITAAALHSVVQWPPNRISSLALIALLAAALLLVAGAASSSVRQTFHRNKALLTGWLPEWPRF